MDSNIIRQKIIEAMKTIRSHVREVPEDAITTRIASEMLSKELGQEVSPSQARTKLNRLVELGILEVTKTIPKHYTLKDEHK